MNLGMKAIFTCQVNGNNRFFCFFVYRYFIRMVWFCRCRRALAGDGIGDLNRNPVSRSECVTRLLGSVLNNLVLSLSTLAFGLMHAAVEDIGINVMAYGQRSQRYATSQILRHQFCFELRTVTPAPANLLGIVLCHYKHPLIISWVLSLAYFDAAEKMPSPDAYTNCVKPII